MAAAPKRAKRADWRVALAMMGWFSQKPATVDENPLAKYSDAKLIELAGNTGNRDTAYPAEMMRRLMVELHRSNRTMACLTWAICTCTVLLLGVALWQIYLQLKGCR